MELLHTATLVHDDSIDRSTMRRGKPTISALWGDTRAILLGDYLFAKAAEFCAMTANTRVVKLCARTLMIISGGELEQSAFEFRLEQVREQYFRWISAKTSALFSMAAESGAILSGAPETMVGALRDYGYNLGMAFQIVDDVPDFAGDEAEMGKPTGSDLSHGILTLPAILFLENHSHDGLVKNIAEILKSGDTRRLEAAADRVRNSPFIRQSFEIAADFSARARQALETVPGGTPRRALLDLLDYALERKK